jgi:hypothetical protein
VRRDDEIATNPLVFGCDAKSWTFCRRLWPFTYPHSGPVLLQLGTCFSLVSRKHIKRSPARPWPNAPVHEPMVFCLNGIRAASLPDAIRESPRTVWSMPYSLGRSPLGADSPRALGRGAR